jgi:hypothetical protein
VADALLIGGRSAPPALVLSGGTIGQASESCCGDVPMGEPWLTRAAGGIGLLLPRDVDIHLNVSLAARRESLTNPTVKAVRDAIHAEVASRRTELPPPVK